MVFKNVFFSRLEAANCADESLFAVNANHVNVEIISGIENFPTEIAMSLRSAMFRLEVDFQIFTVSEAFIADATRMWIRNTLAFIAFFCKFFDGSAVFG